MANFIHPTAIIDSNVILGNNNYIGPYCYVTGNAIIGNNNRFESHVIIGTPPEHRNYYHSLGENVIIGDNNIIREFVTIHNGTLRNTVIGNNVEILNHSHIAHDCIIEDKVNISATVTIAGHVHIMEGSVLGVGSVFHQFSIVGSYSMIGMNSTVTLKHPITPFGIYVGSPAKRIKENFIGIERNNITDSMKNDYILTYNKIVNENN